MTSLDLFEKKRHMSWPCKFPIFGVLIHFLNTLCDKDLVASLVQYSLSEKFFLLN